MLDPNHDLTDDAYREHVECPACDSSQYDGTEECPDCGWSLPSMEIRSEPAGQGYRTYYCEHCDSKLGVSRTTPERCQSCLVSRGQSS